MKLVKEHINERFEEDGDPIKDMGIGLPKVIINAAKEVFKRNMEEEGEFIIDEITLYMVGMVIRTNYPVGWKEKDFKSYFKQTFKESGLGKFLDNKYFSVNYYTYDILFSFGFKEKYDLIFRNDITIDKNNYE